MEENRDLTPQTDGQSPMPSASEEYAVRMALGRCKRVEPDVDSEWQAFRQTIATPEPAPHRPMPTVGTLVRVAIGIAAMLLVVWVLCRPQEGSRGMEVFTASDDRVRQVTLRTDDEEPMGVQAGTIDFAARARRQAKAAASAAGRSAAASEARMLTMATSRGMDYSFVLPDGTRVSLNAESSLRFPEQFQGSLREVELKGEAYFEVTPDASKPFVVKTGQLVTRVYGTAFDVKAYPGTPASVVLVSGKVSAQAGQAAAVMMRPGELYGADEDGNWKKQQVDTYPYVQWKDGFFYFDQTPLVDIMRTLGRWYNINVVFENVDLAQVRLHFVAEKSQPINEIVASLNTLGAGKITLGDNAITIE